MVKTRLIKENEIEKAYEILKEACEVSWKDFYPQGSIDYVIEEANNLEVLKRRAKQYHFYVALIGEEIVGFGAIAPYFDKTTEKYLEDESVLLNIFVKPSAQGNGVGKKLIKTLEEDEYGKRAKRIELSASIVAIPFYKKMGYEHVGGFLQYEDGQFKMEKFFRK